MQKRRFAGILPASMAGFRVIGILTLSALIIVVFSSFIRAKTVYTIKDGTSVTTVSAYDDTPENVLQAAGISISPMDKIMANGDKSEADLTIVRSQLVTVKCDGTITQLLSYGETVEEVLKRIGITLGEHDLLSVSLMSQVQDGQVIKVIRKTVTTEQKTESVPFETVKKANSSLYKGQEKITATGTNGVRTLTYQVVSVEGQEVERILKNSEITTAPVSKVVEYGTKVKAKASSNSNKNGGVVSTKGSASGGTIQTKSGKTLQYSKVLTCTATAYTTENKSRKITAIGTKARVGAIAVDPKVIPYGTKMYIVSADGSITYGVATAEDCGNFKGKHVDLFYNTRRECVNFGRHTLKVYILK